MTQETQEPPALMPEQAQRAEAVWSAANVLQSRNDGKPLASGGSTPGTVNDIVDSAEYIVSGDVYSVKVAERGSDPLVAILGQFGFDAPGAGKGPDGSEADFDPDFD